MRYVLAPARLGYRGGDKSPRTLVEFSFKKREELFGIYEIEL